MKKLNELQSYLTRLRGLMLTLIILCSIGSGNVWGATYTITFKTASSDPSTAISTSETITNIVSEGSSNIKSLNTCTKCYGPAKSGLKLGTGSATGTFKFTLSDALAAKTIRSVTVKTVAYGTDGGNITGTATGTNAGSLGTIAKGTDLVKDYTASSTTKITTIQVATSTKRAYISQIIIETIESATTPTLTVSKSSISSGLTYVSGSGPSAAQTFTVSGSNLTSNVTVTAPTNFEVSKDGSSYAGSQTITASGTLSTTTIYVRLKSGLAVNSYSGNITVASTGATSKTVSLSGSVSAPAYSVTWTINPAAGGTLSTTSGTSTTVTPNDAYTYGSPAYTVTSGSATVSQSTNTFTATPTSDCTIRINMVEKPKFTVTLKDDNSTLTQASYGASVTLPSRTGCTGYTFAGWTKTWVAPQSSWTTTAPTIIPAGSYTPSANENLYPVYTKTESGGTTDYSKTETFENQGASTTYNSTQTYTAANSNASLAWSMYYGTVSTNAVLTGSKSAQMRWYSSATSNIPNIKTTTAVSGLQTLTFNAAVGNTNIKMKVEKSTNGSTWTVVASNVSMSTTKTEYSYDISGTIGTGYYIRIGVDGTNSTAPSSGNYTFRVDDVKFDYQEGGGSTTSYISVPACCTDWSTPTVTYSSSLAINASEGVTISSGTTHGSVTYESSDEDVLTVDADGTIHAVGAGTAHITATWAGDATYCEKSANSNDVTVSGIQVTGTTPVNFGQVYQGASIGTKTIYVTGLGLTNAITPSLPVGSPFSFSPASLAANSLNEPLTISASTATIGDYNQTLTLTSGAFSATVTVKMEVIAKPTATFVDGLHSLTVDKDGIALSSYNLEAAQGTPVVFPTLANQTKSAGTCEGEYYIFAGWTEGDNNTDPEDHLVTSYTLANGDAKHYYAVWADASGSVTYTKLTSDAVNTSKNYVIGAESGGDTYYFYSYSGVDVNAKWGVVSNSPGTDAPIIFTLSGTADALVAKDASNNYLNPATGKQFFGMSATSKEVTIESTGEITSSATGGYNYLRFNPPASTQGLRWYNGETGSAAYFYEVGSSGTVHYRTSCCANKVDAPVVTATAVTSTSITLTWPSDVKATGWQIEWNGAGGWVTPSGSCTHTVSGLTPNTTYTWRVRATYEDPVCGADVRSGSTTTNQVYHVTYAKGSGTGTCTATGSTTDETGYEAGATVTLQANGFSLAGHTFAGWTEDDDDITISSNQFTMPDHDVVITASWTAKMDKYFDRMHDQTDALHGGVAETEGTNEGKYYIPKEGCNYSIPTAVDSNTGDACQTSHYKLQGWIAASHMKGYPNNMTGEIKPGEETYIFPPTGTKTATGATYYAIWAEVTE